MSTRNGRRNGFAVFVLSAILMLWIAIKLASCWVQR